MTDLSIYQTYIAKSRYARFIPEKNRRENLDETVERYIDYMCSTVDKKLGGNITNTVRDELKNAITDLMVMPSMRAMMTAGKALAKDNTCGYNCAYLPIDDIKAFDEAMFILMCGTGVGFSVERQYVNQLPEVPEKLFNSDTSITVRDSKEGWAKGLRMLLALLYSGEVPKWDLSKIRPAGAELKTFGGRASGPEPLDELFNFIVRLFRNARGRRLTSIECHDIMCKIAEVVVVGGVRRSALISLSNLSDDRMRHAKAGQWWEANLQRALSNNSAVYTEKPEVGTFMQEWLSLYESKSGERGIFSRAAAKRIAARNGRRDSNFDYGCNPCILASTLVAVADGRNAVTIKELASAGSPFSVYSAKPVYSNQADTPKTFSCWKTEVKNAIAFKTGTKEVVKIALSNGDEFECTPDHRLALRDGAYVEARDSVGQKLHTFNVIDDGRRSTSTHVVDVLWEGKIEDVYDLTVNDNHNFFIVTSCNDNFDMSEGVLIKNCSEILLRPCEKCNLSEVVVRAVDSLEDLADKVRLATILGTFQSTLTHFPYLRKIWQKNAEEERLLGVSLTGIYDNRLLNDCNDPDLPDRLEKLKQVAIDTNEKWADLLGIPRSTAITCVKPSGTVSSLVDSASGIHPRYAQYYFRRVRSDNKDPLTQYMIDAGVPNEPDITKPHSTTVFTFPMRAPTGALTRDDITAIDHLELCLAYQTYWTEHKPSVTISVKEDEWPRVGAWVYDHFDQMSGVSFLPWDGGTYRQAPFETITKEEYEKALPTIPTEIDWDALVEHTDNVEGTQTLACTAGNCDI